VKVAYLTASIILEGMLLAACGSIPQGDKHMSSFSVSILSADEEAIFVWSLLRNITFYDSNNYRLSMPDSAVVAAMIEKANNNELESTDISLLRADFSKTVYQRMDYLKGYEIIINTLAIANSKVHTFVDYHNKWNFYIPQQYEIKLTLYGPGGSYDPKTGTIIMLITKDGIFKRGKNPLDTVLHEAVHIGIEAPIVSKYRLSHWTKERIVDQFMVHHFMNVCPDYIMQPNAETGIDSIFNQADVWDNLPERVERFVSEQKN
jgi:hypothetical protein